MFPSNFVQVIEAEEAKKPGNIYLMFLSGIYFEEFCLSSFHDMYVARLLSFDNRFVCKFVA